MKIIIKISYNASKPTEETIEVDAKEWSSLKSKVINAIIDGIVAKEQKDSQQARPEGEEYDAGDTELTEKRRINLKNIRFISYLESEDKPSHEKCMTVYLKGGFFIHGAVHYHVLDFNQDDLGVSTKEGTLEAIELIVSSEHAPIKKHVFSSQIKSTIQKLYRSSDVDTIQDETKTIQDKTGTTYAQRMSVLQDICAVQNELFDLMDKLAKQLMNPGLNTKNEYRLLQELLNLLTELEAIIIISDNKNHLHCRIQIDVLFKKYEKRVSGAESFVVLSMPTSSAATGDDFRIQGSSFLSSMAKIGDFLASRDSSSSRWTKEDDLFLSYYQDQKDLILEAIRGIFLNIVSNNPDYAPLLKWETMKVFSGQLEVEWEKIYSEDSFAYVIKAGWKEMRNIAIFFNSVPKPWKYGKTISCLAMPVEKELKLSAEEFVFFSDTLFKYGNVSKETKDDEIGLSSDLSEASITVSRVSSSSTTSTEIVENAMERVERLVTTNEGQVQVFICSSLSSEKVRFYLDSLDDSEAFKQCINALSSGAVTKINHTIDDNKDDFRSMPFLYYIEVTKSKYALFYANIMEELGLFDNIYIPRHPILIYPVLSLVDRFERVFSSRIPEIIPPIPRPPSKKKQSYTIYDQFFNENEEYRCQARLEDLQTNPYSPVREDLLRKYFRG